MWKDIIGFEDTYRISDSGEVWSKDRLCVDSMGRKRFRKGQKINPDIAPNGYYRVTLAKNGKKIEADLRRGYAYFEVADGDVVNYEMNMTPTVMSADPRVSDNAGRVALMRGPVVYCAEGVDNKAFVARTGTLDDIILSPDMRFDVVYDDKLDAPVIVAHAFCHTPADTLYAPEPRPTEQADVRFIPYYAFANRGETDMLVWVLKK